jgi:hypothetical protein
LWAVFDHHGLCLSAAEAIQYGVAHEIGDWTPPTDAKVSN